MVDEDTNEYELLPLMLGTLKRDYLDKGFVEIISNSGYDFTPVERQRISYNHDKNKTYKQDFSLLNRLQRDKHLSPFEHIYFTFKLKIPIFVQRHIVRYRISSINEISGRYTDGNKDEFYIPDNFRFDLSKKITKEQREEQFKILFETYKTIEDNYKKLLELGLPKELQRIIQPVGQYTTFYWTLNMREFFNVCNQRLTSHTQYETMILVKKIYEILQEIYPLVIESYYNNIQSDDNIKYIDM